MNSNRKSKNVFVHSPSLQILWKCASQRRLVTKTLIHSISFKSIYHDVVQYINAKNRRRSPMALILDSHLLLGVVFVYSKTVFLCHQDAEKLYKDAIVHRFLEFETPVKSKLTRKKDTILANTRWQIDIDENLLPDERVLLERDFSIEIPRQPTPPIFAQSPEILPPLPWEVSRTSHGKRITLLPDIEEPMPKFDLIDDRFGEPLPVQPTTAMDVDQHEERTILQPLVEDRSAELLRAPVVDRQIKASDRYSHPSHDRTIDENRPTRSAISELLPVPMELMESSSIQPPADQFTLDALAFFQSSLDVYPTYHSNPDGVVLLGAECSSGPDVPMIVIQEPTMLGVDEGHIPMDTMPPLDQQLPVQEQQPVTVDDQTTQQQTQSTEEFQRLHRSKKKRNVPDGITRRRKYPELYENIVNFDYDMFKTIDEEDNEEFEQWQREGKPWPTLFGPNGRQKMKAILEKAKKNTTELDLTSLLDEVTKIANILINSEEPEVIAQAQRTSQEIVIRRGQSSGILPRSSERSSSMRPIIEDRVSEIPIATLGSDFLPTFPSGFDEIPVAPIITEPTADIRQPLSPIQNLVRERVKDPVVQPSPTSHDKQKEKAINDILNLVQQTNGTSFNKFLKESQATRIQSARLFSILLVLCAEQKIEAQQNEPYGDIEVFIKEKSNSTANFEDKENQNPTEPMEADFIDSFQ